MAKNKPSIYLISVCLFTLLLPAGCIIFERITHRAVFGWLLTGKWFLFWAIGVRLFIAGLRQVSKPAFTAKEIFHISGNDSFPVIRELGFANLSIGLINMLALFYPDWRVPAGIAGDLYFGLAGLMHLFKRPASRNELIALVSDLFIFALVVCYLFFSAH